MSQNLQNEQNHLYKVGRLRNRVAVGKPPVGSFPQTHKDVLMVLSVL